MPVENPSSKSHGSRFLQLPLELRLKIYEYALTVPNDYMDKPLMVVHDRGNVFTSRGRFRALNMCPSWANEDGTARNMMAVNRRIHAEVEDYLYSKHTLFFRNSVDLDKLGSFLDTLSDTARRRIRNVGFEVFFFVHTQIGVPKRTIKQYEKAGQILASRLPCLKNILFYLDPRFYYPSACVGGGELAARGVLDLATRFGPLRKSLSFYPLPSGHQHLADEIKDLPLWGDAASIVPNYPPIPEPPSALKPRDYDCVDEVHKGVCKDVRKDSLLYRQLSSLVW
ncbi:hypothetical protein N7510_003246 [Penicillium lagena]|uniref:uncharacterized protein n=1 Tax=Penicillium lagena TaxID=94218 RepID=UPI0025415DA1|nr:uncharacterized protein N7510_003246 [Penicillium lagena]KAJ5619262.1 hypothetical protein N7510_003246 [Penicillium lagena]